MLSSEIIAQIKSLELRGRHLATDIMSGEYTSAFHGRGMEFHEVREYVPGDDVRGIDWNVTARMNQPFVKVFREERELTLMLLVDVSSSLNAGQGRSRREIAAELAAILAWLAIKSNDRVGLILFGDKIELFVPPRKGPGHVWRIIRDVLTWPQTKRATNIDLALEHLSKMVKRRSVCFLISDFLTHSYHKSLGPVSRQHDLTCVYLQQDPLDGVVGAMKYGGVSVFRDSETGELLELDTASTFFVKDVTLFHQEQVKDHLKFFEKTGASCLPLTGKDSIVKTLAFYLQAHHGQRRRQ